MRPARRRAPRRRSPAAPEWDPASGRGAIATRRYARSGSRPCRPATRRSRAVTTASAAMTPSSSWSGATSRRRVPGEDVTLRRPVAVGDHQGGQLVPQHDEPRELGDRDRLQPAGLHLGDARLPRQAPDHAVPTEDQHQALVVARRDRPGRALDRHDRREVQLAGLLESRRLGEQLLLGQGAEQARRWQRDGRRAHPCPFGFDRRADLLVRARPGAAAEHPDPDGRTDRIDGLAQLGRTAAASASPSGRRRPIAAHGSSGTSDRILHDPCNCQASRRGSCGRGGPRRARAGQLAAAAEQAAALLGGLLGCRALAVGRRRGRDGRPEDDVGEVAQAVGGHRLRRAADHRVALVHRLEVGDRVVRAGPR